jgi:hypothetical protein
MTLEWESNVVFRPPGDLLHLVKDEGPEAVPVSCILAGMRALIVGDRLCPFGWKGIPLAGRRRYGDENLTERSLLPPSLPQHAGVFDSSADSERIGWLGLGLFLGATHGWVGGKKKSSVS